MELIKAARKNDLTRLTQLLESRCDTEASEASTGLRALGWASLLGNVEAVELLLKHGANVNNGDSQGNRPLRLREGYRDLLTSPRLLVPAAVLNPFKPSNDQAHLITTPFFSHLWFLWDLWWLTLVLALVLFLANQFPWLRLPELPQAGWQGAIVWILLALIPQLFMSVLWPSYGPDTLTGLLPAPHLLLYYGIFFTFGARAYGGRQPQSFAHRWRIVLPVALFTVLPLGILLRGLPLYGGILQVLYAWLMSWGMLGLFRETIRQKQFWISYLSDASYFLYLAHFPVVLACLSWVRPWQIPTPFKVIWVCVFSTGLLLVVNQFLVRNTWLGRLLNGKRGGTA